jgi:hypothetical protein
MRYSEHEISDAKIFNNKKKKQIKTNRLDMISKEKRETTYSSTTKSVDNDTDNNKNIKEEKRNRNCGHFIFKNRVVIAMNPSQSKSKSKSKSKLL